MSTVNKSSAQSSSKLPPVYGFRGFGGINRTVTTQGGGDLLEASDMVNFRIDGNGMLVKRSGYTKHADFSETIRGAWFGVLCGEAVLIVVSGSTLWRRQKGGDFVNIGTTVNSSTDKVEFFAYGGMLYMNDGSDFYRYDGDTLSFVEGYVPLVKTNVTYNGTGMNAEKENMLTRRVRIKVNATAQIAEYVMPHDFIQSVQAVYANGVLMSPSMYSFQVVAGIRWVFKPVITSNTNIENYYEIHYTLRDNNQRSVLCKCRHTAIYNGESVSAVLLFGGSEGRCVYVSKSNADGSANPEYYADEDKVLLIDGSGDVTAMIQQYESMLLFSEQSAYFMNGASFTSDNGDRYTKFTLNILNSQIGCVAPGCAVQLQNEPVSVAADGVYRWVSTYIQGERNTEKISLKLGRLPTPDTNTLLYDDRENGELFIMLNGMMYVFNYLSDIWYKYNGITASGMFTYNGKPAFYNENTIYVMDGSYSDDGEEISASFEGLPFDFGRNYVNKSIYRIFTTVSGNGKDEVNIAFRNGTGGEFSFNAIPNNTAPETIRRRCEMKRLKFASIKLTATGTGSAAISSIYIQYGYGGDR